MSDSKSGSIGTNRPEPGNQTGSTESLLVELILANFANGEQSIKQKETLPKGRQIRQKSPNTRVQFQENSDMKDSDDDSALESELSLPNYSKK